MKGYFPVLCKFASTFLPDASLAKDVVQETFIHLWGRRADFASEKALKAYLFASTRNGCLNLIRGRDRQEHRHLAAVRDAPEATDSVLAEMVRAENMALIYQVIQGLPLPMQEIFRLSYEEGMTVAEISAHLRMKLKTVKNHKYKTLLVLRDKFGNRRGPLLAALILLQHI